MFIPLNDEGQYVPAYVSSLLDVTYYYLLTVLIDQLKSCLNMYDHSYEVVGGVPDHHRYQSPNFFTCPRRDSVGSLGSQQNNESKAVQTAVNT